MVGRNDPCPCGSGKKYKKCCLGKEKTLMESQGTPNMATDIINQFKDKLDETPFSTLEELTNFAKTAVKENNSSAVDDFLGLTSSQMYGILYSHFLSSDDILSLAGGNDIDPQLLLEIPIIKQTLYIMSKLGESEKGVKATKTGNLPRSLVQAFYFDFSGTVEEFYGKPMSQRDVRELDLLVFALKETGLIKIRTGWISLTKKGKNLLVKKEYFNLYSKLFHFYGDQLDWLSTTYLDETFGIIQQALSFSLYILREKAENYISEVEITEYFHKAFPQVGDVSVVFVPFFLDGFCFYFGLVERDGPRTLSDRRKKIKYRQSRLFPVILEWK
ncbi:MAG: SEC-C metal-binding domain-containing protein [Spirochaetota bacterium]|nr:SEC-C metal-binding domain-containing protein [Spirochaetota bacterium]